METDGDRRMKKYTPSETAGFAFQLYGEFKDHLDEPSRRRFLAEVVEEDSSGAQSYVREMTKADTKTLERGRREIDHPKQAVPLKEGHQ